MMISTAGYMHMDMDSESDIPTKHRRKEDSTRECIIYKEQESNDEFCKPKDEELWGKPLDAAVLQQCDQLLKDVPDIYYHSECRKKFCHKKTLARL